MAPSGAASAQSAAELFDADTIHDIWLTLEPAHWKTIRERYLEDDYYRADFMWNGHAANGIGLRSRGNSSRSPVKPSLKIDFSRYDSKRTFAGLRSVILRNLIQEVPMMREYLSLLFMRSLGLPASRATHARLFVNGEYSGLYLLVEDIDERFLVERFPGAVGDLYEYEWTEPYYFEYRGRDPAAYSPIPFKPQTNKKTADLAALPALFRAINEASDNDFVTEVDAALDWKMFINYLAADSFLTETDSLLSTDGVTNFYLYRLPATGRFLFLPWDKNATLLDAELSVFWRSQQNVLIRRALANPRLRAEYLDALRRCAEAAGGDGGWLEQKTLETYRRIRRAALEDTLKPFSNQEFEDDCESLRFVARSRSSSVLRQVEEAR